MTNYEKYRKQIEKFTCLGINFGFNEKTEKFYACYNTSCKNCMFSGGCIENKIKWAYSEYIEQEVDWSKVAVDTPILVSSDNIDWYCRHFAKYENGLFYVWDDGRTSYTTNAKSTWEYAKLVEVENGI